MKSSFPASATEVKNICVFTTLLTVFIIMQLHNMVEGSECTMARQLLDPYVRAEYDATVESGRITDNGWLCGTPQPPGSSESKIFDPISMECINCHDGTIAPAVGFKFVTTETLGTVSVETLRAAHPIGQDYTKYSCNTGFNYWGTLPTDMVLMNGQIGCASCHNLLGTNRLYLTVDMSSSELCFTCHRK